jgi:uncharacterized protein
MARRQASAVVLALSISSSGCLSNPAASRPEWRKLVRSPEQYGLVADTVSFVTRDSLRLRAWWISGSGNGSRATIILAHGSGTNRSGMLSRAAFLVRAGYDVLDLDLRAHGESEGNYMSPGWREADDIRAAVAWTRATHGQRPIVVLGHSYGAVAALHAGSDPDLAAVVADAPFKSYDAMIDNARKAMKGQAGVTRGQRIGMAMVGIPGFRRLIAWQMSRQGAGVPADSAPASFAVTQLRTPAVLFLAGQRDPIAPAADVRLLCDSARAPRKQYVELPGATHSTYGDAAGAYEQAVLTFLSSVLSDMRPAVHAPRSGT